MKKDSPNPISPRKLGLSPWPRADLPAHKLAQLEAMRHHADKQINNLQEHQYNEYPYNTSKLNPGVYFAEIKSDKNESKLIKLLKTK